MKPGQIVLHKDVGKDNVVIRYTTKDDVSDLWEYINEISKEKTFITFQGEEITMEEEQKHVDDVLGKMEKGTGVKLLLYVNNKLCGVSEINLGIRTHSHVGLLGLSVSSHVRGKGLGRLLLATTIDEAKKQLQGLHMIELTVFANNPVAIKLYTSVGFQEGGRIPEKIQYKGELVDEIVMYLKV